MPELVLLDGEVASIFRVGRDLDRDLLDHLETEGFDTGDLARVVRQDPDRREPEVGQDLRADPVLARVRREARAAGSPRRCRARSPGARRPSACSAGRSRGLPGPCRAGRRAPRPRSACSASSSCSPQSQRSEWKTSPVRHSEWTRTSTSGWPSTFPWTSATWCFPVRVSRKATAVKSPYSVGRRTVVTRSTSFSVRRRYSIRSATVTIRGRAGGSTRPGPGRGPSSRRRS